MSAPVQYKQSFYAIGTRADQVRDVEFFSGFTIAGGKPKSQFSKISDGALVVVYTSASAAAEVLCTITHPGGSIVEVIAL